MQDIEVKEKKSLEKPEVKEKKVRRKKTEMDYVVTENFFYKGFQFHSGQKIGFNEFLLKTGKIRKE